MPSSQLGAKAPSAGLSGILSRTNSSRGTTSINKYPL